MRPSVALELHRAAIRAIVTAHRACNPRVFGSVLSGNDAEGSDLDLLIDTTPETSLFDLNAIGNAIEALLGVRLVAQPMPTERERHPRPKTKASA